MLNAALSPARATDQQVRSRRHQCLFGISHAGASDEWQMRHAVGFLAGPPGLQQADFVVEDHALN